MFRSTQNRGFSMTFNNGLTISVQFGTGNYCERRSFSAPYRSEMDGDNNGITSSSTAEIAIWHKDSDQWFDFGRDQVKGWCDTNEVAIWIDRVSNAGSIEDLKQWSEKETTEDEGPEYDSAGFTEEDRVVDGQYQNRRITKSDVDNITDALNHIKELMNKAK